MITYKTTTCITTQKANRYAIQKYYVLLKNTIYTPCSNFTRKRSFKALGGPQKLENSIANLIGKLN